MSKKHIIILSVILLSFVAAMIIIAVSRNKPNLNDMNDTEEEHQYAVNDVKEKEDEYYEDDTDMSEVYSLGDITVYNIDRLSPEQNADKESMFEKINASTESSVKIHGNIISEEILDTSDEYDIYVRTTYEDSTSEDYVCLYDPTSMHSFLRCITVEEWEEIKSGANAG